MFLQYVPTAVLRYLMEIGMKAITLGVYVWRIKLLSVFQYAFSLRNLVQ